MRQTNQTTNSDILDALDHMSDFEGKALDISDFKISKEKEIPLSKIPADFSSWVEFDDGELLDMSESERFTALNNFRKGGFANRAMGWISKGKVPPVILVELSDGYADIGDGRGRINVSIGMGWKKIPVIKVKQKSNNEKIKLKNNPTYTDLCVRVIFNKRDSFMRVAFVSDQESDSMIIDSTIMDGVSLIYKEFCDAYKVLDQERLSKLFEKSIQYNKNNDLYSKTVYDGSVYIALLYKKDGSIHKVRASGSKWVDALFGCRSEIMYAANLGSRIFTLKVDDKGNVTSLVAEDLK